MKYSIFTAVIASTVFISGCTTMPTTHQSAQMTQPTWQKTGVAQDDVNSALQKCRYDIGMANISPERENALLKSCIESKGYRYTNRNLNENVYLQ